MNKKLMAVAVAAAMAPGLALAQSSVTISGIFKVGVDNISLGQRASGTNHSETRVTDNSSRIIFNVTEDLGGGLQAIAQMDGRFAPDISTTFNASGNTWVGLRGKSWGTLTLGRHDLHYGKQPDDIASKAGALMGTAVSLMDYAGGGSVAIANGTRTNNVVRYDTPQWGIFSGTLAYSTNATGVEADLTALNTTRKGRAWNVNPVLTGSVWQLGYSYWNGKSDAAPVAVAPATTNDQRGDVIYGYYRWGGFKLGAAWNKSRLRSAGGNAVLSNRTAWTIPVSYTWGKHNVYAHYTKARSDRQITNTGASMFAAAYVYDLSKRTTLGVTMAKITNSSAGTYNFFTNANTGVFGSVNAAPLAGEDPRLIAVNIRHAF